MNELQNLIQKRVIETGHVEHAAIFRRQDHSLRVASAGLTVSADEIASFVALFDELANCREEGVPFNGSSYRTMRADKHSIYAVLEGAGLVLVRTKTLVIFTTWMSPHFPSVCIEATENLASYFKEKGK